MTRFFFLGTLIILVTSLSLSAQQENLNQYDAQGKKHGTWIKKYPNGNIQYKATFEHGKPVDTMKRYHENGNLKAIMKFKSNNHVFVELYDKKGEKKAQGNYQNRRKDSTWTLYSLEGDVISKENYDQGELHGKTMKFYPDGDTSQVTHWQHGKRDGTFKQFFEDGTLKLIAYYTEGKLDGPMTIFYPDGYKKTEGIYKHNLRDGKWIYYTESADTAQVIEYKKGEPMNEDKLELKESQEVIELEQNQGKFGDPRDMLYNRRRRRR